MCSEELLPELQLRVGWDEGEDIGGGNTEEKNPTAAFREGQESRLWGFQRGPAQSLDSSRAITTQKRQRHVGM